MNKYDTLEYSRVKPITVSVSLWNFLCALTITNTKQTKVASSLDTTSTLSTTTLAPHGVIHLYQGPLLEYPPRGRTMTP
jgi:hypothetical protein